MWSKLYDSIAYHRGDASCYFSRQLAIGINFTRTLLQAIIFLGNWPSFKKVMALWNFSIPVNGKTQNVGYFWWPIPWVSFGVIRNFANFQFYDFQKTHYSSIKFHPISSKLYRRCYNHGTIQVITFFLNTGPYGAENFKVLFLPQFSLEPIQTLWEHWLPL